MSAYQTTISKELDCDISRHNILNHCLVIWPNRECTVTVNICPSCRVRGHQQFQAKVMASNQVVIKGGCENTEEEALDKLYLWVQNYWAYRPDMSHP